MAACVIEGPPAPEESSEPEAPLSEVLPAVEVRIAPAEAPEGLARRDELRGLVTALIELDLADLEGVVPRVGDTPPSPALALAIPSNPARWTAQPVLDAIGDALTVSLQLCDPKGVCETRSAVGTLADPQVPVAELLRSAATRLGRDLPPRVEAGWRNPLSKDSYAVLLAGRAAAVLYGLREGAPEALMGDKRLDPIDRAAFVDPMLSAAAWALARRDAARGAPERARDPLPRGGANHPWSVLFLAEDAALLDLLDKAELAYAGWQDVGRRSPHDARFLVPLARAALRAGDPAEAGRVLDALPAWAAEDPAVLRVRVGIAGPTADDALLARLQAAAPQDPEPVRRRIALRVQSGDYAAALALTEELRARGQAEEADRLALALAVGAGKLADASAAAGRLGLPEVQARIQAREALTADPARVDAVPAGDDLVLVLARAEALRQKGAPEEALQALSPILAANPWQPDALEVRAEALDDLGRLPEADEARQRLALADPAR